VEGRRDKSNDHMTLREFPRSRCGKSAGSIAFTTNYTNYD
jgi:hypothetical protein